MLCTGQHSGLWLQVRVTGTDLAFPASQPPPAQGPRMPTGGTREQRVRPQPRSSVATQRPHCHPGWAGAAQCARSAARGPGLAGDPQGSARHGPGKGAEWTEWRDKKCKKHGMYTAESEKEANKTSRTNPHTTEIKQTITEQLLSAGPPAAATDSTGTVAHVLLGSRSRQAPLTAGHAPSRVIPSVAPPGSGHGFQGHHACLHHRPALHMKVHRG